MVKYPEKREKVLGLNRKKEKWLPVLLVLVLLTGISAFAFRDKVFRINLTDSSVATLRVDGLFCPACPPKVKAALEKIPGVISADVELATERAIVRFDQEKVSPRVFEKTISELGNGGYHGTVLVVRKGTKG